MTNLLTKTRSYLGVLTLCAFLLPTVVTQANEKVAVIGATSKAEQKIEQELQKSKGAIFPLGQRNVTYEKYFTGTTYVAPLARNNGVNVATVTFLEGAHTFWHIHHGTCQVLMGVSGSGYYQIWGEEPHKLMPGESFTIPEGVKHWHGAAPKTNFQHVVVTGPAKYTTEWLEEVDKNIFNQLK